MELQIEGMHCQACGKRIENALLKVPGVTSANVNGATNMATIHGESLDIAALSKAVEGAGYKATKASHEGHMHDHGVTPWSLIAAIAAAFLFLLYMIFHFPFPPALQWIIATAVQFGCGWEFYRDSFRALRNGAADMNVLIAMGTTAAWGLSSVAWLWGLNIPLYFESSVFIIAFVLIGRWLESRFKRKASAAIRQLLQLQPRTVHIEEKGGFVDKTIDDVVVGSILQVLVGERIPVDGVVVGGDAEVDESMMTGESRPVKKNVGDKVFSGTLNINGILKIEARQVGTDTLLAHIVQMVSDAQNSKAPAQKLADTISSWFVPAVILLAIATYFFQGAINAISVLVIACPCALGLATPIVIVVAAGIGASKGILFKDAEAFDKARSMQTLFIDKTGTLTSGSIDIVVGLNASPDLLMIAGSLDKQLKHPLAHAIVKAAGSPLKDVEGFTSYPGKGVEGMIDGVLCGLGSPEFAREKNIAFEVKDTDKTIIVVWKNGSLLGYLLASDHVRDHAAEMVSSLAYLGVNSVMLTGDREAAAKSIAGEVGIQDYRAALLPQDKLALIEKAKSKGFIVGMVGDGINDAPALAAADVGIALEASTDVALESASIALLGGDLMGVVHAVELSRATYNKIVQNLGLAFLYNIIAIPLAVFGFLTPAIAGAAMAMSSLSVVLNALRLSR